MEAVCSDQEVEAPRWSTFERDMHSVTGLLDAGNAVTEHRFASALDLAVDQPGEIAARKAHVQAGGKPTDHADAEAPDAPPCRIDEPYLFDVIAAAFELRKETHPFRNVVSESPKIDDIASGAQPRGPLHQHRPKAVFQQPVCQCGTSDANTGDEHGTVLHVSSAALATPTAALRGASSLANNAVVVPRATRWRGT